MNKRLLRGGSWSNPPWWVRSAIRNWTRPTNRLNFVGFRLAGLKTEKKQFETIPSLKNKRLLRGGSWLSKSWWVRSANRDWFWPTSRNFLVGFRLAGPKTEKKEFEITRNAK